MNNLLLITGDEVFERNECLEKIKSSFGELVKGINYIVLDKDNISSLENEINTYAFGFDKKLISVVGPCFNEEKALPIFMEEMEKVTSDMEKEFDVSFEYIFIDDGSRDATPKIMKELSEKWIISVI